MRGRPIFHLNCDVYILFEYKVCYNMYQFSLLITYLFSTKRNRSSWSSGTVEYI